MTKLESVKCGVCGSDDRTPYAEGKDYEYGTSDDTFHIDRCNICGNLYLNPRPVREELSCIYPPNYYAYNYDSSINPIALKAKEFLDRRKAKNWLKYVTADLEKLNFLDVGCGNGRYLQMLHRLGVPKSQLYGIEMSEGAITSLQNEGYNGYYGRLEDVENQLPENTFDLIVLLQVIEHVEFPKQTVQTLSRLLRSGGILVLETPNTQSWDANLFRLGYWGGYHFPRHWNLFDRPTLNRLVTAAYLQVKDIQFLPSPAFWILSYHHAIADKWQNQKLANWFDPLQNLPLLSFFTAIDLVRAKLGFSTSNIQFVAVKSPTL
ncbi:MAG TPA: class I SAM-dependent methyltransferase [Oscillatoriales cyanobacterium M59_W2019_021]|nr:class I SAM-dependent methyltransferase [Oscillatoriales cyanobacterium M59_W2019_021]